MRFIDELDIGCETEKEGIRMPPGSLARAPGKLELLFTEMAKTMGGTTRSFFLEMLNWRFLLDT